MGSDLFLVIIWWTYIFLLGLIFLPVASGFFKGFFDSGYLFSKVLGILTSSYSLWLLSSFRLLPFYRISIFSVIAVIVLIIYTCKGYSGFKALIIEKGSIFFWEEMLFLAGLIFWSYIRGLRPEIYGLEKFMDYGFVNSLLKTVYMPPLDMWFAGESINYYYFGHYICAFLSKLTNIESSACYNLMLAVIFSFTLTLTFSLVSNAVHLLGSKKIKSMVAAGIISALLVTLGGNLHAFIYANALPFLKNAGIYKNEVKSYFYADSTRYIGYNPDIDDKTIHEFPMYSFTVSDLHGHVSDIPFVLTFLALVLVLVTGGYDRKKMLYVMAFMLAIFYMTNTWDTPIYLTVGFFAMFYSHMIECGFKLKTFITSIKDAVFMLLLSMLISFPYALNFKNITYGVGIVSSHTPLYQLLVLWGYQLVLVVIFLIFLFYSWKGSRKQSNEFLKSIRPSDMYILILAVSAAGLVLLPEIIYIKDIYGATYQRANTMFKFTYQAFIMFGVSSGYIVSRVIIWIRKGSLRWLTTGVLAVFLSLPMIYPYYAIKGYYVSLKPSNYKELYGLRFLKNLNFDDYEAVKWLQKNTSGQEVVLETWGDPYSDYNRVSMATGNPTILGWIGHEWLWRAGGELPTARSEEVNEIYESKDIERTWRILRKYDVSYILIGRMEKERYKNINETKLLSLGTVVFDSPGTRIIKLQR